MGFNNPITGGQGALVRPAIKSPNYVTGVSGWSINKDGSAEFNDLTARGSVSVGSLTAGTIGNSTLVNCDYRGGTIEETKITFDLQGGLLLVYSTTVITETHSTGGGTGTFAVPGGITALMVECWGGGGSGAASHPGGGGGGGEYAAEFALAVTPAENLDWAVGAGSSSSANGGDSTLKRSSTTLVRAHGGRSANGTMTGQPGGSGSTNSVRFNGGRGGDGGVNAGIGSGGGGGSSAGTSANGSAGAAGTQFNGGTGGVAPSGGGNGGKGGDAGTSAGVNGSAPGGGGGGAPTGAFASGNGAAGKVIISYVSASTLIAAIAPAAGTDPAGTAYPKGISGIHAGTDYVTLSNAGALEFGASGSASDTNLYRNAASVLKTDDDLIVAGKVTMVSTRALPDTVIIDNTSSSATANTSNTQMNSGTTFVKVYADTQVLLEVCLSGFTNTAGVVVFAGININSVDRDVTKRGVNNTNVHVTIPFRGILVAGLAAGSYSFHVFARVSSGTFTMNGDDVCYAKVTEVKP